MKTRVVLLCTLTLVSLLSLFGFAAQADAQDNTLKQLTGSPKPRAKTGKPPKAKVADAASGYAEDVLYSFCSASGCTDGQKPFADLIQDAAGNLYGTTSGGGISSSNCLNGSDSCGTVFKLDSTGNETVLYSFCSAANCADGDYPLAGLIRDSAGNLYGTTVYGGTIGFGTVFKVDNTGHQTVLHSFCSEGCPPDGLWPYAALVEDSAGNLYGATQGGGYSLSICGAGCGTVFKLARTGQETVLYNFCPGGGICTDGANPYRGRLIQDAAGSLYFTTQYGGNNGGQAAGTVFKVDRAGNEKVLYRFCSAANCTDGYNPYASGVIQDTAGNLYGTTLYGGASGAGTVFKLEPPAQQGGTWTYTVLYSFCSEPNCADGAGPNAGVIMDAAGNLYGTAGGGGRSGAAGTVFKLEPPAQQGGSWAYTVLYSFCSEANCTDGAGPHALLIQDAAGNFYSTTSSGGANNAGTVFKLIVVGQGKVVLTLTSAPNPSYVNQPVTLTTVVSGSGSTPTGQVTFEEGGTALGTVRLSNGQASLGTTFKKRGSFSILASYSGDQNYGPANSNPLTQVVMNQYTTSTTIVSNLNPSIYGQLVSLTATVSSAGPTPTGTVTFKNGSKTVGSATLSGGVATLTTSALPAGTLSLTASYGGDAANKKSTSPPLKQVVNQATSTTAIASSLNPSKAGQKVTFTATVTSPTATLTGTVKFLDGTTELGTGTLKKGKAAYSTSMLSSGSHNITAVYAGTVNISGSTSPVLVQIVN